jgi:hypothetical protein
MNVSFAYTVGAPDQIYYGKYYGYASNTVSEADLLDSLFPSLQQCYSIHSVKEITISVFARYSNEEFTDRDPFKYNFVYCNTPPARFYLNGTLMN